MRLSLDIEKDVYIAGQTLRGWACLHAHQPIENCVSIFVEFRSTANCFYYKLNYKTDNVKDSNFADRTVDYAVHRLTLVGSVYKTPIVFGAGNKVIFNPPWDPMEGRLIIPPNDDNVDKQLLVQVRSQLKGGGEDSLLGEFVINVADATTKGKQGLIESKLFRAGKPVTGIVTYSFATVVVEGTGTLPTIVIHFHSAIGMKTNSWIQKGDVYIQVYRPPTPAMEYDATKMALPEPSTFIIAKGDFEFDFDFLIPEDTPSSFEYDNGQKVKRRRASVKHTINCGVEVGGQDLSCTSVVKIIQPAPVRPISLLEETIEVNKLKATGYPFCIPPFVCFVGELTCCNFGNIGLGIEMPCSGFEPNNTLPLGLSVLNATASDCNVVVNLLQKFQFKATGSNTEFVETHFLGEVDIPPKHSGKVDSIQFVLPSLAPTFPGISDLRTPWLTANRAQDLEYHTDPVSWEYELEIELKVAVGFGIMITQPIYVTALPPKNVQNVSTTRSKCRNDESETRKSEQMITDEIAAIPLTKEDAAVRSTHEEPLKLTDYQEHSDRVSSISNFGFRNNRVHIEG